MKLFKTTFAALALAALPMAAFASTVHITASDVDGSGDDVRFTVQNTGDLAISMITFDVSQASDVGDLAQFKPPMSPNAGSGAFGATDSGSAAFFSTDADAQLEQIKWTFDDNGLDVGSSFAFTAWIQYLNDETAPGLRGGIDVNGDRLSASVMFEDGSTSAGFFTSLGAPNAIGGAVFDVAPVPLPASALLLMGGLAGMGAMRRRKKAV